MSRAKQKDISKGEWKVMKIVWELRKAMAREVYTIAGERHSWSPGTVKTILKRLVDKGFLEARAGKATKERGRHPKRYYKLTALGASARASSHRALMRMWRGLPQAGVIGEGVR